MAPRIECPTKGCRNRGTEACEPYYGFRVYFCEDCHEERYGVRTVQELSARIPVQNPDRLDVVRIGERSLKTLRASGHGPSIRPAIPGWVI